MSVQLVTGQSQGKKRDFSQPHLGGASEVTTDREKSLLFLGRGMTVKIKGYSVQIDDEDEHIIRDHGWCVITSDEKKGLIYFQASINKRQVLLHRIIMKAGNKNLDHRDGDTLNNKKANLRFATKSQNGFNRGRTKKNTSGYKGVIRDKRSGKWHAQIKNKSKHLSLGYFSNSSEAHEAYKKAAIKIAGEFARW